MKCFTQAEFVGRMCVCVCVSEIFPGVIHIQLFFNFSKCGVVLVACAFQQQSLHTGPCGMDLQHTRPPGAGRLRPREEVGWAAPSFEGGIITANGVSAGSVSLSVSCAKTKR